MILSKDQILGAKDFSVVEVEVPEWGGTVCLRPMSGVAYARVGGIARATEGDEDKQVDKLMMHVLVNSICDADGNLLFTPKDIEALGTKTWDALERLFDKALEISGLSVEDAVKN